jgi:hypothetical protein
MRVNDLLYVSMFKWIRSCAYHILYLCKEWQQTSEQTKYNCSHDNYLSFNKAQSTEHLVSHAKLFQECTGGVINFAQATEISRSRQGHWIHVQYWSKALRPDYVADLASFIMGQMWTMYYQ